MLSKAVVTLWEMYKKHNPKGTIKKLKKLIIKK